MEYRRVVSFSWPSAVVLLVVCISLSPSASANVGVTEIQPTATDPEVFACIGWRPDKSDGAIVLADSCATYLDGTPARTRSSAYADQVVGATEQYVLVRLTEDKATAIDLKARRLVEQVVVTAGSVTVARLANDDGLDENNATIMVPLDEFEVLDNSTVVTVRVEFAPNAANVVRKSDTSYFTLRNKLSRYGVAKTGAGFWIPYGLLASNFDQGDNGISLAAFPVGVAWGTRWYPSQSSTFYLGGSFIATYAVHENTDEDAEMMTGDAIGLRRLSLGALVDLSGYAYVGGAYIYDLRKGQDNPGFVAVLGAGPQLLQVLQAAKR